MIFYQYLKKCLHWSYLLKNKILELPYCTLPFLVTRSFYWYQNICPCDLGHCSNWPLSGALCFTNASCFRYLSFWSEEFSNISYSGFCMWTIPERTFLVACYQTIVFKGYSTDGSCFSNVKYNLTWQISHYVNLGLHFFTW